MQVLFYILVIAQIALGLYSLWDGFVWFRMVRQRIGTHSGFYTPATALICPCKGNERGLEENLMALTRFDYPNYEIYFTLATSLGSVESVVSIPVLTSHAMIPAEERAKMGVTEQMIRLSVGIENADDLIADLEHALEAVAAPQRVTVG